MAYGFYPDIVAALRAEAKSDDHRGAGGLCRDAAAEIECLRSVAQRLLESYLATFSGNKDDLAHEVETLLNRSNTR